MGRPLYSAAYSQPAVRAAPEPATPATPYEKWSRWGSFDPDSDEFFESDDAVYEAFLDPSDLDQGRRPSGAESIGVIVEREMERSYSPVESLSSDSTVSGRVSPMAEGPDDPAAMVADAYHAAQPSPRRPAPSRASDPYNWTSEPRELPTVPAPPTSSASLLELISERRVSRNLPRATSRTYVAPRPSTQNSTQAPPTPVTLGETRAPSQNPTPSPAPAVTPRIYSWSAYSAARGIPNSPTPAPRYRDSPLPNTSARMSIPHLSPAPMRIRAA